MNTGPTIVNANQDEFNRDEAQLTPMQLIKIARGFNCIFWGIPLSLLLWSGALKVELFAWFELPAYVIGPMLVFAGLVYCLRADALTPLWRRRARAALFVIMLQMYLAPFLYWWVFNTTTRYYQMNVLLWASTLVVGLVMVNQLAGEVGKALNNTTFRIEATCSGWMVILCTLVSVIWVLVSKYQGYLDIESNLYLKSANVYVRFPRWIFATALLPFTLTMACCWKAKASCFQHLVQRMDNPPASG